jgi:hypothetical protein
MFGVTRQRVLAGFASAFALLSAIADHVAAQDAADPGLRWRMPTGELEVAVADKYIYNGYLIQDQGPIVQPYLEVVEEFYRGNGWLTGAAARFSFFSSLQPRQDGVPNAAAPGRWLYEIQIEAGLELELANQFTLSLSFLRFKSPIDVYQPSNALQLTLTWDDEEISGWFALHPHVTWLAAFPLGWNAEEGDGNYFEIGIAPSTVVGSESPYPITLTLPLNAGFGDDNYYPGDAFGYASIGFSASVPLAFLSKDFGEWNFAIAGAYYRFGRAPAELSNDGDRNQSLFSATLSTEF